MESVSVENFRDTESILGLRATALLYQIISGDESCPKN